MFNFFESRSPELANKVGAAEPNIRLINNGKNSVFYDLYIDLLGTLVPGLMTLILGGALIFWALFEVRMVLVPNNIPVKTITTINTDGSNVTIKDPGNIFSSGAEKALTSLHWELSTVIIVSSYIIGSVFFRQDPKVPDAISAWHIWIHSSEEERKRLAVQMSYPNKSDFYVTYKRFFDFFTSSFVVFTLYLFIPDFISKRLGIDVKVHFPYSHLKCYLAKRRLTHLAELIPWCPNDKNTDQYRTKMFINVIKIRLLAFYQNISKEVIRNEAHVRLATSVWYATATLTYLAVFVIVMLCFFDPVKNISTIFLPLSSAVLLLIFCLSMNYHLLNCIHYMRVREVIYVLESARIANTLTPDSYNLFDDSFKENSVADCSCCDCA